MNYDRLFRLVRSMRNQTGEEFGKWLGISVSYVSLLEANRRSPSRRLLDKFAKLLAIRRDTLELLAFPNEAMAGLSQDDMARIGQALTLIAFGKNRRAATTGNGRPSTSSHDQPPAL